MSAVQVNDDVNHNGQMWWVDAIWDHEGVSYATLRREDVREQAWWETQVPLASLNTPSETP